MTRALKSNPEGDQVFWFSVEPWMPNLLLGAFFGLLGFNAAAYWTGDVDAYQHILSVGFVSADWIACALIFFDLSLPHRLIISSDTRTVTHKGGFLPDFRGSTIYRYDQIEAVHVLSPHRDRYDVRIILPEARWNGQIKRSIRKEMAFEFGELIAAELGVPVCSADIPGPAVAYSDNRKAASAIVLAIVVTVTLAYLQPVRAVFAADTFVDNIAHHRYAEARRSWPSDVSELDVVRYATQAAPNGLNSAYPTGIWYSVEHNGLTPYFTVRYHCRKSGDSFTVGLQLIGAGTADPGGTDEYAERWHVIRIYRN